MSDKVVNKCLNDVSRAIWYLFDRGELDPIYTGVEDVAGGFVVNADGRQIKFTAQDIGEGTRRCDLCGDDYMGEPDEDPDYPGYDWCGECEDD